MMNNQNFYKEVGIPVAKKGYQASVGSWPLMAVKSSGVSGAIFGAGMETVSSVIDVMDGKKDMADAVVDIAGAGVKGGVTGAVSALAGSAAAGSAGGIVTTAVGGALVSTTVGAAAVAAAPVVIGFSVACAVAGIISDIFD